MTKIRPTLFAIALGLAVSFALSACASQTETASNAGVDSRTTEVSRSSPSARYAANAGAAPEIVLAGRPHTAAPGPPVMAPPPAGKPNGPVMDGHAEYPGTERFKNYGENPWTDTSKDSLSTFAIDVDTASYTLMRSDILVGNKLPAPASVRPEEYVNYFDYDYEPPAKGSHPFAVHLEAADSPYTAGRKLVRVAIKGYEVPSAERKPCNLVFLIDVSGSMGGRLPLVKHALEQLLERLDSRDTLGIVVYAGREAVLMQPTRVRERGFVRNIINGLQSGGGTAGAAGIRTAYKMAREHYLKDGINRVVLCTDGDFNVGLTGDALVNEVAAQRDHGVGLSTFLFGRGNINDATVEQLANKGNGNHAYIDSPGEAVRAMGEKVVGMLQVIAQDVKIQVEFSNDAVKRYRLIGYENRDIADQDFRNDAVDAGELGAGHSVTALYEAELMPNAETDTDQPLATVRLRYKKPDSTSQDEATEMSVSLPMSRISGAFADASPSFQFATAVAWFAQLMKRSQNVERATLDRLIDIARRTAGDDPDRKEFLALAIKASDMPELYEVVKPAGATDN
ncbi:MAG: von Willebrand factor type A domain-containing protein [Planctomycetota bacterium]